MSRKKITTRTLKEMKQDGKRIAALTAYDYLTASILDASEIDLILVGDSAGMVIKGQDTTVSMSMDEMLYHVRAVHNGVDIAFLLADMPFLAYQTGIDTAVKNAGMLLQAGAEGVKVEGGEEVADIVHRMVQFGIPVMGHIGLQPQSINVYGGYQAHGMNPDEKAELIKKAQVLEDAGCFGIVLEKIVMDVAKEITHAVHIPTIGIGSGPHCDGQVLVTPDMLGMNTRFKPRFVRPYAELETVMTDAFQRYVKDVKMNKYPTAEESY